MQASEVLGYLAATLTTVSFVPQAWRTFRTKDVSGISLKMYSLFTLGVAVWLAPLIQMPRTKFDAAVTLMNALSLELQTTTPLCVFASESRLPTALLNESST